MAPIFRPLLLFLRRSFDPALPSEEFTQQWTHPGDVFSVLLILGGDVVARALAQLAGSWLTPVAFSFGWVAYAITAVVSAMGENKLMPPPDTACKVINGKTGYVRDNASWILGRVVRDYETWMDGAVRERVKSILDDKHKELQQKAERIEKGSGARVPRPTQAGLCVAIYRADPAAIGSSGHDAVYKSGFGIAVLQLGIAAIPCGVFGDWSILLITAAGITLAFATGSLTQWRKEKWACRLNSSKTVVLTRGNGAQHAIVVRGAGVGFDLEDLSAGPANVDVSASYLTRITVVLLALAWILLLISAAGIKNNTWFLLGVGGIGILQNIFVAGWRRTPTAFGMPLVFEQAIGDKKVMDTLFAVEELQPNLGLSMRDTFFPGRLRDVEVERWEGYAVKAAGKKRHCGKCICGERGCDATAGSSTAV